MDPVEDIDEEFCTQCNMAFPTLNDCLIVHGQRYCQECAMLIPQPLFDLHASRRVV